MIKKFALRLTQQLYKQLKEIAEQNKRSVNSEIIVALETYVKSFSKNNR